MSQQRLAKSMVPRSCRVIRRARIAAALDRALESGVAWVAAPAGYGKTTAVADFARAHSHAPIWFRVDAGDRDIAAFTGRLGHTLPSAQPLPLFLPACAGQPAAFARRFFRAFFAGLRGDALLVLDDVDQAIDSPAFREVLAVLLAERPPGLRCACLGRTPPPDELADLGPAGRLSLVDESTLAFDDADALSLFDGRLRRDTAERIAMHRAALAGWPAGLALLADRRAAGAEEAWADPADPAGDRRAWIDSLLESIVDDLDEADQDALLRLCLLPDITAELAAELTGSESPPVLERLHQRRLLIHRIGPAAFRLHDLLRAFLVDRLGRRVAPRDRLRLHERTAWSLERAQQPDQAIDVALAGGAWPLARRFIAGRAASLLAEGGRATLLDWCARMPADQIADPWICYWLGVAHVDEAPAAEPYLARAWAGFVQKHDLDGQCLTAARAVLVGGDAWPAGDQLNVWVARALEFVHRAVSGLPADDQLLAWSGLLRAIDFAGEHQADDPVVKRLTHQLLTRLSDRRPGQTGCYRLLASRTLIQHAAWTGKPEVFEKAVDTVAPDLRDGGAAPRALGLWLVAFGSVSGRRFGYARRGFPYAGAEEALRAAVEIGAVEGLRGIEFDALYHLQLSLKRRGAFAELAGLIGRMADVADERDRGQAAVVADCQASLHTLHGRMAEAYQACDRFTAAVEAAGEPALDRWPHMVTRFELLLVDRKPAEAADFLAELLPLVDGEAGRRLAICLLIAQAFRARWSGSPDGALYTRRAVEELCASGWQGALHNSPQLAAELFAAALDADVAPDFCRAQIARRALAPPARRPVRWPWALRIHVLGEPRVELDGEPLRTRGRAAARSLVILYLLAVADDHACRLDDLHRWVWPDVEIDLARSACEQALRRLRKLLGAPDLVVQRDGAVRLSTERTWIDLEAWQAALASAGPLADLERVFWSFPAPLGSLDCRAPAWLQSGARVRGDLVELTRRIGQEHEARGDLAIARTFYLRALDLYPAAEPCYEALLRGRLAEGDAAGVLADFRRYDRILRTSDPDARASMRALITPHLPAARTSPRAISDRR